MGYPAFFSATAAASVDGVLTVDLPPEEAAERIAVLKQYGIDPIFLLAPTTPANRLDAVARMASGYVYYVSLKGVTRRRDARRWKCRTPNDRTPAAYALPIRVGSVFVMPSRRAQLAGSV